VALCEHVFVLETSDAEMVRVSLRFLRQCHGVPDDRVTLAINCYLDNGLDLGEIEDWWLKTLELPRSSLRRSHIGMARRSRGASRNVLVHGTARITVCSTATGGLIS
jgi:hypothetical protein